MSGPLIDFVEARLDAMHGVRGDLMMVREPAAPPITPNSVRKMNRDRHATCTANATPKITASVHEHFGWLEEFIDVKLEMMQKRDSITASMTSQVTDASSRTIKTAHRGRHEHRRSLSRRDSLGLELQESMDKTHRRMHSRRESLLIGLDQDVSASAALAA